LFAYRWLSRAHEFTLVNEKGEVVGFGHSKFQKISNTLFGLLIIEASQQICFELIAMLPLTLFISGVAARKNPLSSRLYRRLILVLAYIGGICGGGILGSPTSPASVLGVQLIYLLDNFT